MTSYSYSLDRQIWAGRFASRKEAIDAAIVRAINETSPPATVFVGQRIEPDLRAYGHARGLIQTMRRRVLEDNGDMADGFLGQVDEKQIADLDHAVEASIREWLTRWGLQPNWVRIEAVGEYPIPASSSHHFANGRAGEIGEMGVDDAIA